MEDPVRPRSYGSLAERLAVWLEVDEETGCHTWKGHRRPTGYGMMAVAPGEMKLAHRVAWELANGPIPEGMLVRHKCDNRACCNPEHLALGTYLDNARDRIERKRTKGCWQRDLARFPQWRRGYCAAGRRQSATTEPPTDEQLRS